MKSIKYECTRCKLPKSLSDFYIDTLGYKRSMCRTCNKDYQRERARKLGIKQRNLSRLTPSKKLCTKCNKFVKFDGFRKCKEGLGGLSSYCLKCQKKYNQSRYDPEKSRIQSEKWRKENPEKWKALHRIYQFNRKSAIKATDDGTVTPELLKKLFLNEICRYCKTNIDLQNRTIEHVIPLNRGGEHSSKNLDMACFSCNSSKRDLLESEFINFLKTKVKNETDSQGTT